MHPHEPPAGSKAIDSHGLLEASAGPEATGEVADAVASIGGQLTPRLSAISEGIQVRLATEIDRLAEDDRLVQLLLASVESNVDSILHTFQHGIDIKRIEAPPAAIEYACRLAQRGVPANALVRAYRLGQDSLLRTSLQELERQDLPTTRFASAVAQQVVAVTSAYVDRVTERVVTTYEEERDRWLLNRNAARIGRIREILDGRDVSLDSVEQTLGYRLRQNHLGLIAWAPTPTAGGDELARMERLAGALAERIGCEGRPLFVPCDELSAWVWLPLGRRDEASKSVLKGAVPADEDLIKLSAGEPHYGVDGFRRTHRQAAQAHAVAAAARGHLSEALTYGEVGPVALLCQNVDAARVWVDEVLGPLAANDDTHARMRDTVRVFLDAESSYTAAAHALCMHKNTVAYRVRKAEGELGRPIREHRHDLETALKLCHWLGPSVLREEQ